ncbi:MAG: hypothetical protein IAG13_11510 [Deltaproteobacteria bacterium]|nr:hypothetical protein [Nannocystaceae bacterium]
MSNATKIGLGFCLVALAVLGVGVERLAAAPQPEHSEQRSVEAGVARPVPHADASAPRAALGSGKAESLRSKRERIRERREQRTAAGASAATTNEREAIVTDSCDDGCIGTLSMQIALAQALSGCRDDLPEQAEGKTKFRVLVIAEPGIGAVVDGVEVLENEVGADFAECVVQSAPLAELSDPEHPIADDFVFRYTIGEPANPASEFLTAHPELARARPELVALASRASGEMTSEEMTAFARWIDEDPTAQAAFGSWAAEAGLDLAKVRVD